MKFELEGKFVSWHNQQEGAIQLSRDWIRSTLLEIPFYRGEVELDVTWSIERGEFSQEGYDRALATYELQMMRHEANQERKRIQRESEKRKYAAERLDPRFGRAGPDAAEGIGGVFDFISDIASTVMTPTRPDKSNYLKWSASDPVTVSINANIDELACSLGDIHEAKDKEGLLDFVKLNGFSRPPLFPMDQIKSIQATSSAATLVNSIAEKEILDVLKKNLSQFEFRNFNIINIKINKFPVVSNKHLFAISVQTTGNKECTFLSDEVGRVFEKSTPLTKPFHETKLILIGLFAVVGFGLAIIKLLGFIFNLII